MRENNPFPKPIDLGEGYLEFGSPLEVNALEGIKTNIREGCAYAHKELERFELSKTQNNIFAMKEHALICLKDFYEMMHVLETSVNHPTDLDKVLKDTKFSAVVDGIRKNDFIGMFEKRERGDDIFGNLDEVSLAKTRDYLLKAEIYRAAIHE